MPNANGLSINPYIAKNEKKMRKNDVNLFYLILGKCNEDSFAHGYGCANWLSGVLSSGWKLHPCVQGRRGSLLRSDRWGCLLLPPFTRITRSEVFPMLRRLPLLLGCASPRANLWHSTAVRRRVSVSNYVHIYGDLVHNVLHNHSEC